MSTEQERQCNSKTERCANTEEVHRRCAELKELAEIEQNADQYVADINKYTDLKYQERVDRERHEKEAEAARPQQQTAVTTPGTTSSQYTPMVLAILGDPENN